MNPAVALLLPVFNDWGSLRILLGQIDEALARCGLAAHVFVVDDGSTLPVPDDLVPAEIRGIASIEVLHLRRNLGHQRALSTGLSHLQGRALGVPVVVMDADGEDSPFDIETLVRAAEGSASPAVVFAGRARRAEGLVFRFCYRAYQIVHLLLVGSFTRIGNFSVIPPVLLEKVAYNPDTWNHYAAAVVRGRIPYRIVPIARGTRIAGQSQMDFVSLVVHGLAAMSVYGDVIGARLLTLALALTALSTTGLVAIFVLRFATDLAIPGWATYAAGLMASILLQSVGLALVFTFVVLGRRAHSSFVPVRDSPIYVSSLRKLL